MICSSIFYLVVLRGDSLYCIQSESLTSELFYSTAVCCTLDAVLQENKSVFLPLRLSLYTSYVINLTSLEFQFIKRVTTYLCLLVFH